MPSQSSGRRGCSGGRILIHDRDVNDNTPIIGEGNVDNHIELGDGYEEEYQNTISKNMEDKTRKDYRRRIIRIANYWETNCPIYYSTGVRIVDTAEYSDKAKFYYDGKYKKDIVYTGFNVKFLVKFWMENKLLKDGKLKSLMDIRKYKDAVMWGAGVADEKLPTSFYESTEKYLKSYKKLAVQARKDGNMAERASDPITFSLYASLLKWSIESNNIFVWV